MDRVDAAFSEYDSVRSQVEQYQAAIIQHTRGDLNILLFQQRQGKHVSYHNDHLNLVTWFLKVFVATDVHSCFPSNNNYLWWPGCHDNI